jgi:hypothetical protein
LGEFINHKFHGKGILITEERDIYEGNFVNNAKTGEF